MTAAPAIQPYFKVQDGPKGQFSNWSERHIAYVAGLGTFSLADSFITEKGAANRVAAW